MSTPCLAAAVDQDVVAARRLAEALRGAGRADHPATAHLAKLQECRADDDDVAFFAAVAFEAGVRVHLGRQAGADVDSTGTSAHLAGLLVSRPAMPWEAESHRPMVEVDWRMAMARMADTLLRDRIGPGPGAADAQDRGDRPHTGGAGTTMPRRPALDADADRETQRPPKTQEQAEAPEPGPAAGFRIDPAIPGAALADCLIARADARSILLGDTPRNEVLDPVAANGAFLAQAMPGFVDLDMRLRAFRLAHAEGPI